MQAAGLVIRDLPILPSNFRSMTQRLDAYLRPRRWSRSPGLDTRKLTRVLREGRAGGLHRHCRAPGRGARRRGLAAARRAPSRPPGHGPRQGSSASPSAMWKQAEWALEAGYSDRSRRALPRRRLRLGVKYNILRMLVGAAAASAWCRRRRRHPEVLALNPDGVFLSNGPATPSPATTPSPRSARSSPRGKPTFGICLGHQMLAPGLGAKTMKMSSGHHGANHPVRIDTGKC